MGLICVSGPLKHCSGAGEWVFEVGATVLHMLWLGKGPLQLERKKWMLGRKSRCSL